MKFVIPSIFLIIGSVSYSQPSLTGKWKPVFYSLDSFSRGDVKADTFYISPALKESFKKDKDPEASEKMTRFLMEIMFEKMKETEDEYFEDGKYTETNIRTGRTKSGTYIYKNQEKTLQRIQAPSNKKEDFAVSWKNDQLILTGDLESANGKKGKVEIVFEKASK